MIASKKSIVALLGVAVACCAAQSQAAINWTYSGNSTSAVPGNTVSSTAGGVTATAQAWANTNDGISGTSSAALGSTSASTAASYKLETAYLGVYSGGLGVNNQDGTTSTTYGDKGDLASTAPEHAIDNNQRYDSVLFSFTNKVNLTQMTTGYVSGDSDFTVWYYSGLGAPSLAGTTYGALGAGWNLLGSYNGGGSPGSTTFANSNYSSYWLIGAYNDLISSGQTSGNDYFKIATLTGTQCIAGIPGCGGTPSGVPEPGSLLLVSAGLAGLARVARRPRAPALGA